LKNLGQKFSPSKFSDLLYAKSVQAPTAKSELKIHSIVPISVRHVGYTVWRSIKLCIPVHLGSGVSKPKMESYPLTALLDAPV